MTQTNRLSTLYNGRPLVSNLDQTSSQSTHLLLWSCLLLWSSSLLLWCWLGLLSKSLLEISRKLVGVLYLNKISVSNSLLEGRKESCVHPLLILWKLLLHDLLDCDHGGSSTVLELRDCIYDSCFVRHGSIGVWFKVLGTMKGGCGLFVLSETKGFHLVRIWRE